MIGWFVNRVTALQGRLCSERPLLIIPGIDGRNNARSQQLVKWLFLGQSGLQLRNNTIYDDDLEDMFVLVEKTSITIFCNPLIQDRVLKISAQCQNAKIICKTKEKYGNTDEDELFKIQAFQSVLEQHKEVTIPVTTVEGGRMDDKAKMVVEKWPLVQAFGLQELGNKGFFTLGRKIFAVKESAWNDFFGQVDARCIGELMGTAYPLLARHWTTMCGQLDGWTGKRRTTASEAQFAEPLTSFYSYALLSLNAEEKERRKVPRESPKVLIGGRTGFEAHCFTESTSQSEKREEAKGPELHFTVEGQEPMTAMRVVRTYFLSNGGLPNTATRNLLIGSQYTDEDEVDDNDMAARLMMQLYSFMVEMCGMVIESFGNPPGARVSSRKEVLAKLLPRLLELAKMKFLPALFIEHVKEGKGFDFHLSSVDATGRRVEGASSSPSMMFVSCALGGITSMKGTSLGGVKYGDSFAFADLPSATGLQTSIALTKNIPVVMTWPLHKKEADYSENALPSLLDTLSKGKTSQQAQLPPLGEALLDTSATASAAPAAPSVVESMFGSFLSLQSLSIASRFTRSHTYETMLTGMDVLPRIEGRVTCFERGLVVSDCRYGPIIIDFARNVLRVRYCDGNFDNSNKKAEANVQVSSNGVSVARGSKAIQEKELKTTNGDGLFIIDVIDSDFGLFKGLRMAREGKNTGPFAAQKNALVLAIVLKKDSLFRRSFIRSVIPKWEESLKILDLRCDAIDGDEIPAIYCSAYDSLVESCVHVQAPASLATMTETHEEVNAKESMLEVDAATRDFINDYTIVSSVPSSELAATLQQLSGALHKDDAATTIPLIVLTGLPGSGKYELADAMSKAKEGVQWHVLAGTDLSGGLAALAKKIEQAPAGTRHQVVHASCGFDSVVSLVRSLQAPAEAHGFAVVSVVAVVNAATTYLGNSLTTTVPHFTDQLVEGFVDTVVLRAGAEHKEAGAAIRRLVRSCNPHANIIAVSGDLSNRVNHFTDLDEFQSESQAKLRTRSGRKEEITSTFTPLRFACSSFPFSKHNLHHYLDEMLSGSDLQARQGPSDMRVYHVRGLVNVEGKGLHDVWAVNGGIKITSVEEKAVASSAYSTLGKNYTGVIGDVQPHVTFFGQNLDHKFLQEKVLLRGLRKKLAQKNVKCLSPSDMKDIRTTYLQSPPLPSGWCFNGSDYVDSNGKTSKYRPDMDAMCADWVHKHNSHNAEDNAAVSKEHANALAEWAVRQ